MLKPALSTLACPDWTLDMVAQGARRLGFEAVELRTFGEASRQFACDPALTSDQKVRRIFSDAGVEILSLATSCRFDAMIYPPVVGHLLDQEQQVREARRAIDLAIVLECPYVRVFAYECNQGQPMDACVKLICERLRHVVDHADKSGVKVVLENAGSFASAADIRMIIDRVNHPLLGASYSLAAAPHDTPEQAVALLANKLWVARIKDLKHGKPVALGQGDLACERYVRALSSSGFHGPLVFEWDRAWLPEIGLPEDVLKAASRQMFEWAVRPPAGSSPSIPAAARR